VKLVVDASVAVKWFLGGPNEQWRDKAEAVAASIDAGSTELLAPCHWTAEVIAVVTRLEPSIADHALELLTDMRPRVIDSVLVLRSAAKISVRLDHHLFDTLYHAVALEAGGMLVTADERYFKKAEPLGHIALLGSWNG
jgi:predicted nucleic acid-binding protein